MADRKIEQRKLVGRQRRGQQPASLKSLDAGFVELRELVLPGDAENVAVVGDGVGEHEGMKRIFVAQVQGLALRPLDLDILKLDQVIVSPKSQLDRVRRRRAQG